jgi:hypothetical protein
MKKEHCFAACVPAKLEDSQPFICPRFVKIRLNPWVLAVVGNSSFGIAGLTHMASVDVCWILVAASRDCITVGENPACYESHTYCKLYSRRWVRGTPDWWCLVCVYVRVVNCSWIAVLLSSTKYCVWVFWWSVRDPQSVQWNCNGITHLQWINKIL